LEVGSHSHILVTAQDIDKETIFTKMSSNVLAGEKRKGERDVDSRRQLTINQRITIRRLVHLVLFVLLFELPPAAYKRYSLCAWRLHPNTRNQAKGMLEVLRLAM